MSWSRRWKSKNLVVDPRNPNALGICDYSGFAFNRKDLVEQMEWRGNNLVGTNFFVGRQYLDTPQEQYRPPLVKSDPKPIYKPRPEQPSPQTPPYDVLVKRLNNTWNT